MLLGKKLLITGVLTPQSIAFFRGRGGAGAGEIVLTNFGRTVSLTEKTAKRLPDPDVLEMDVNEPGQIDAVREELARRWGRLDGFLHAIAFAPRTRSAELPAHAGRASRPRSARARSR